MGGKSGSFYKKNMRLFTRFLIASIALICNASYANGCGDRPLRNLISALSSNKSYCVIDEDVDLSGRIIELPNNTVIDFRGGSLSNGTVLCNDNVITGLYGVAEDVIMRGTVKVTLNLNVFRLRRNDRPYDLGKVLNQACSVCKSIVVPDGVFFYQTPVVLEGIKFYQQFGDVIYNGTATNITTFQFNSAFTAVIDVYGKIAYDTESRIINYTKANRTNIVGVEFANINNSKVYIGDVEYFNNNIRISAYGGGNCYNQYTLNLSVFSNEHLRICQGDSPEGQFGWCNENVFIGGRFCNWSHFDWTRCESEAIRIEGVKNDSYNSANSLLFLKPCMEGFVNHAVYAKNVTGCHWQDARTEGTECFIRFVGNCHFNEANASYGTESIQFEECFTYPLIVDQLNHVLTIRELNKDSFYIDTKKAKLFKIQFANPNADARVGIKYVTDKHGYVVSRSDQKKMLKPRSTDDPDSFYFNEGAGQWKMAANSSECNFYIPNEVTKVLITLTGRFAEGLTIYSDSPIIIIEQ